MGENRVWFDGAIIHLVDVPHAEHEKWMALSHFHHNHGYVIGWVIKVATQNKNDRMGYRATCNNSSKMLT